jgi:hypothetical protein
MDATGALHFVMVIFAAKELSPKFTLGIDIFVKWDNNDEFNVSPRKCHSGLSLSSAVNGKNILVWFAAIPKASMTSTILKETLQIMDEVGITQRGVDGKGDAYLPADVIGGHISRMGKDFLQ